MRFPLLFRRELRDVYAHEYRGELQWEKNKKEGTADREVIGEDFLVEDRQKNDRQQTEFGFSG